MLSDAAPLISVLMVTFNEGQFIGDAIKSVLAQTIADFELIIVDDGSLDDTESIVRTFSDQRVQYVRQKNQGPPAALNTAIATARGSFIALTNGDALSHPERLARQLDAYHESGGGVIFTNAEFIDETGAVTTHAYWPRDFFLIPPMSRANIVERLFYQGNFFPTFTMFGSRQLFQEVGPSDTLLWQLSDLDLLLRLICRAEFHVMPDRLVSWRLRCGDGNLSAPTIKQQVRSNIETFLIGKNFLERLPKELFVDAFRRRFRNVESVTKIELECERAFLHAGNEHGYSRIIAVERLYALFGKVGTSSVLLERFGFDSKEFVELMTRLDVMNLRLLENMRDVENSTQRSVMELECANEKNAALKKYYAELGDRATQDALLAKVNSLEHDIEMLRNSRSWRCTRPLRVVGHLIRRKLG